MTKISLVFSILTYFTAYEPFTPSYLSNACPSRITAAAGTSISRDCVYGKVIFFTVLRTLQPNQLSSFTQYCWIKLSFIVQYSLLLAKNQPGPYFSSSVIDHPLRPIKDRRLGKLVIYQLPNLTQTQFLAGFLTQKNLY